MGIPPVAVDIMTSISGVSWARAWKGRVEVKLGRSLVVPFLGFDELLVNKQASGRDKDLIDAANLRELSRFGARRRSARRRTR